MTGSVNNESGDRPRLTQFISKGDRATALYCPDDLGITWLESEYLEAAEETKQEYLRRGELAARPHQTIADGLEHAAAKAIARSQKLQAHAKETLEYHETATSALGSHRRRTTEAKAVKWARWGGLLVGDIAGISGAALLLGEEPVNAFSQGLSSGVAVVTLGAVGAQARYMVSARARQLKQGQLDAKKKQFSSFFAGPKGEHLVKAVIFGAIAGLAILSGAIFTLRTATEGAIAGLTFGMLSLALGAASFVNAYDTADEVAEFLDDSGKKAEKARKVAKEASEDPVIKARAEATAMAESIREEHRFAGEAAAKSVTREMYAAMGRSTHVVGHGVKSPRTTPSGAASSRSAGTKAGKAQKTHTGRKRGGSSSPNGRTAKRRQSGG